MDPDLVVRSELPLSAILTDPNMQPISDCEESRLGWWKQSRSKGQEHREKKKEAKRRKARKEKEP